MYEQTFYAIYNDGSTGALTVQSQDGSSVGEPALPKPGRLVTEAEYATAQADLKSRHDAYVQQLRTDDMHRVKGDYEALTTLGVPDATARRITGWTEALESDPRQPGRRD